MAVASSCWKVCCDWWCDSCRVTKSANNATVNLHCFSVGEYVGGLRIERVAQLPNGPMTKTAYCQACMGCACSRRRWSCPRSSWRTGATTGRRSTPSRATTRRASPCRRSCTRSWLPRAPTGPSPWQAVYIAEPLRVLARWRRSCTRSWSPRAPTGPLCTLSST